MLQTLTPILVLLMGLCLLGIVCWLLIGNQQGSPRTLHLSGQLLFPLLGALLITLNLLGIQQTSNMTCSGPFMLVRTVGTTLAVLIILFGIGNFLLKGRQNRLLMTQPALVAVLLVTLIFLVSYFGGCL